MKVDMSPKAVSARLKEMGELCELSWKLMNSKKVKSLDSKIDRDDLMNLDERKENEISLVHEAFPKGT